MPPITCVQYSGSFQISDHILSHIAMQQRAHCHVQWTAENCYHTTDRLLCYRWWIIGRASVCAVRLTYMYDSRAQPYTCMTAVHEACQRCNKRDTLHAGVGTDSQESVVREHPRSLVNARRQFESRIGTFCNFKNDECEKASHFSHDILDFKQSLSTHHIV